MPASALRTLVNGEQVNAAAPAIGVEDRGLQYGDGLFETMLLTGGRVRFQDDHLARLRAGCIRLGITPLSDEVLRKDLEELRLGYSDGVIKLIVTRGCGGRGYRTAADLVPTRILSLYAPVPADGAPIDICWCTTRLARNAQLAGMKHLNRLEQVLAQSEFAPTAFAEGLMLDTEGELVCATSGNVFAVIEGTLATPDLRFAGVLGVMRRNVIAAAIGLGIAVDERPMWPAELASASELFLCNAVRGLRPARGLDEHAWNAWPICKSMAAELGVT